MKKPYILLIIIVLLCVSAYLFSTVGQQERETAKVAVADVVAISESWNADALRKLADPGLIKAMSSQGQSAEDLLKIYSALGKLKGPVTCKPQTTTSFMKGGEQHTNISYECGAEYEKAPAVISLTLSKADKDTQWMIYYINIRSDIFGGEIIE